MALSDRVAERVPDQVRLQLSRAEDSDQSTTIDTTWEGYVCADVVARMLNEAGITYSDSDGSHVMCGILGYYYVAHLYGGASQETIERRKGPFEEALRALAKTQGRNKRVTLTTNSRYNPTKAGVNSLPDYDRSQGPSLSPPYGGTLDGDSARRVGG